MTMLEIITTARHLLNEKVEGFWEDTELLGYADDCQEDLIKRLPLADIIDLQVRQQVASSPDTDILLSNSSVHRIPSDCIRIDIIAGYVGRHNAKKLETEDLWTIKSGYLTASQTDPVYYISNFVGGKSIIFSPAENNILFVYYKRANKFTSISDTPEVNTGVHSLFIPYLCYRALAKDNELNLALVFKKEYDEAIKNRGGM